MAVRKCGCSCPVRCPNSARIRSTCRKSGSASARRLVAWSSPARLLKTVATLGSSGPKLFSSMASARRKSDSASPSRLVSLSSPARLLRSGARWGQPRTYDACDLGLLAFACLAAQQNCPEKPKHCSAKFLSVCGALRGLDSPALIAVMS